MPLLSPLSCNMSLVTLLLCFSSFCRIVGHCMQLPSSCCITRHIFLMCFVCHGICRTMQCQCCRHIIWEVVWSGEWQSRVGFRQANEIQIWVQNWFVGGAERVLTEEIIKVWDLRAHEQVKSWQVIVLQKFGLVQFGGFSWTLNWTVGSDSNRSGSGSGRAQSWTGPQRRNIVRLAYIIKKIVHSFLIVYHKSKLLGYKFKNNLYYSIY